MKYILLISLAIISIGMLYLGMAKSMLPPALTGFGFLLVVGLVKTKD